jgi:hypothetical protein
VVEELLMEPDLEMEEQTLGVVELGLREVEEPIPEVEELGPLQFLKEEEEVKV